MSDTEQHDPSTETEEQAPPKKRGGVGRAVRRMLITLLFLIVVTGGVAAWLWTWMHEQYRAAGPLQQEVTVVVEPGSGLQRIAGQLSDAGVIGRQEIFIAMLRYTGQHRKLKAGEYLFEAGISQEEVTRKLIENDIVGRFLTVPEGLTVVEVLALVEAADGLTGDMPTAPPQGSLLPETYQFSRGDSRADLIARMQKAMQDTLAELWEERAEGLPFSTPEEALVLASIVEKETGVASERARVAGVFVNRLNKPMRLQSDPTVVYALTEGLAPLGRTLTRQDWKLDHAYNTYQIDGLPPGPIANPGRDAIAAVLNPAQTKDLYFVADGTGGHAFAETLTQHNRNVAKWRKIRDQGN